jgi:DNA-binding IclR family transcriptional regulator
MAKDVSTNVERAMELLLALGQAGSEGSTLQDLARALGHAKPAVHRALASLTRKGFVEQAGRRGRYRLGPTIHALARRSGTAAETITMLRPALVEVAATTGHSAYLIVRAGLDAVCLDMQTGSSPIQTLTSGVGGRIPLGIGPGSLSILATLDEATSAAVIRHNETRCRDLYGLDATALTQAVKEVRARGFAFEVGTFFPQVGGVGVAVCGHNGAADAALSIAAPSASLDGASVRTIADTIGRAIAGVLASRETSFAMAGSRS